MALALVAGEPFVTPSSLATLLRVRGGSTAPNALQVLYWTLLGRMCLKPKAHVQGLACSPHVGERRPSAAWRLLQRCRLPRAPAQPTHGPRGSAWWREARRGHLVAWKLGGSKSRSAQTALLLGATSGMRQ